MNCLFCNKEMKDPFDPNTKSLTFYDCDNHVTRVYFYGMSGKIIASSVEVFDGIHNYRMINYLSNKSFKLSRTETVMSRANSQDLLNLECNLDITPENAKQQLARLLSLVVFS